MILNKPIPCGTLNRLDPFWPTELISLRTTETITTNSLDYFNRHWLPVYLKLENGRSSLKQTVPTVFSWRSGACVDEKAEFECEAYPYETIMLLHACAVELWNQAVSKSSSGGKPDLIEAGALFQKAAGIYQYIHNNELDRWMRAKPPRCAPVELDRGFVKGMFDMCLAEFQFQAATFKMTGLKSKVDTDLDPAAVLQAAGLYLGCFRVFTRTVSMFSKLTSSLRPAILQFAQERQKTCFVESTEAQLLLMQDADPSAIVKILENKQQSMPVEKIGAWLTAKKAHYAKLSQQIGISLALESPGPSTTAIPIVEAKEPVKFTPFTLVHPDQKEYSELHDAVALVVAMFDSGKGWPDSRLKVVQALKACMKHVDSDE